MTGITNEGLVLACSAIGAGLAVIAAMCIRDRNNGMRMYLHNADP